MKIIYLAGIDGSGKTTLAKNLEATFQNTNDSVRYFYARHFPLLMKPLKFVARITFLRKTEEFGDYEGYVVRKKGQSRKHRWLAWAYMCVWLFDYFLITYIRLTKYLVTRRTLILDRYFFDVAINISIALDLSDHEFQRLVEFMAKLYPSPDVVFYLDLPVEVAFRRKNDIQSAQYLEERQERYRSLTKKFHWISVDATATQEQIQKIVLSHLVNGNGKTI